MFKFIHAADIHLDSPLLNLTQYDGAPVESLRVATREAFDNLVRLAIDEQVRFVVIAGDLYDKDSPNFNTPMHVRRRMRELDQHGIGVYIIQGNHDATTEANRAFRLTMPDNVRVFSTRRPETVVLEDVQVALHGQGFATKAVEDDLSHAYPAALSGHFNIGLLHTNLGGNAAHDNYAPSTREGLSSKQYQYWALGHIHKRNTSIGPNPHIIYPGNTQGRHIRESGPKGCVLVTVTDDLRASVSFRATDVWRWQTCEVDATTCRHPSEVVDQLLAGLQPLLEAADDRSLAVRVRIVGSSHAHLRWLEHPGHWQNQARIAVLDRFEERVWIEKIEVRTSPPVRDSSQHADASWGELIAKIQDVEVDDDLLSGVLADVRKVLQQIPHDVRLDAHRFRLDDSDAVEQAVRDAKQIVIAKLMAPGEVP